MKKKTLLFLLSFSVMLSSCMLGPKKEVPDMELSSSYKEQADEGSSETMVDLSCWWEQFKDPLLEELVQETFSSNFDLRIAQERVKELRANYRMESAPLWPQVNAFGSSGRLKKSETIFDAPVKESVLLGPPVQNLFVAGFDASWELDFFGKNLSAREAAYFDLLASQEQVHAVQITVLSEVVRLYTEIRAYQQRILVVQKRIFAQQQILTLYEDLEEAGLSNDIDVENQLSQLAEDESLLPNLEQNVKQGIYQLSVLLGKQPEKFEEVFLKRKRIPTAEGRIPVGLPSDLLRRRPDIRKAERDLYAAGSRIGEAKADLFPSFSLTGFYGTASAHASSFFKSPSRFWLVWPSVNWKLFEGWKTVANIKVQKSKQKQSFLAYEQTVTIALKEVESALVAYFEENHKLDDLTKELKARKRICLLTKALYQSGLKDMSDVLRSYKQLFDTQDRYLQSKETVMTNLIAIYKALGGGWDYSYPSEEESVASE